MGAQQLDSTNFKATVEQAGLTLVDFYADWCGPCRMVGPVIAELAAEYAGKATIGKLNVDDAGDIAQQYGVQSIPTLIFFKGGKEVKRITGALPKPALALQLDTLLAG